jgi:hypothetical protein
MNQKLEFPELSEKNLLLVLKIIRPESDWQLQEKFYYDPINKRKFYKVDFYSKLLNIVIEYEGPNHYCDVWKALRDEERKAYFLNEGIKFVRWPYFCQLNKEILNHLFGDIDEELFKRCLQEIYKTTDFNRVLASGFHKTKNTPSNFTYLGINRFFEELDSLPELVKNQILISLKIYCQDYKDPNHVLGTNLRLHDLVKNLNSTNLVPGFFRRLG